jgi:hypothetical protein
VRYVGADQKLVADVVDDAETVVADLRDDRRELGLAFRQIFIEKRIPFLTLASI